jgi:hypothetical protein
MLTGSLRLFDDSLRRTLLVWVLPLVALKYYPSNPSGSPKPFAAQCHNTIHFRWRLETRLAGPRPLSLRRASERATTHRVVTLLTSIDFAGACIVFFLFIPFSDSEFFPNISHPWVGTPLKTRLVRLLRAPVVASSSLFSSPLTTRTS